MNSIFYESQQLDLKQGTYLHKFRTGACEYFKNGQLHRDDGPAVIYPNGDQYWWKEGKIHRDDGPATVWSDGTLEWWKEGKPYEPSAHELMAWKMHEK